MPVVTKFILTVGCIVGSTAVGYAARRSGKVGENVAAVLMTFVVVVGYSLVGLLSIWGLDLRSADAWLPALGAGQILLMTPLCIALGRLLWRDRSEVGLFAISAPLGNTGFTMGGFVIYLLQGDSGLGLVSIFGLMWTPMMVLVTYPVARHYSARPGSVSLGRLMFRSIFDWRSIGLPLVLLGLILSLCGVARPAFVARLSILDVLMFAITPMAYFSIGLRLRFSYVASMKRMILAMAGARFVLGAAVGLGLVAVTYLTAWPLTGPARDVFLIEAFVPGSLSAVAVANMFSLRPREASVLFVANTLSYLVIVLPAVIWIFGR